MPRSKKIKNLRAGAHVDIMGVEYVIVSVEVDGAADVDIWAEPVDVPEDRRYHLTINAHPDTEVHTKKETQ